MRIQCLLPYLILCSRSPILVSRMIFLIHFAGPGSPRVSHSWLTSHLSSWVCAQISSSMNPATMLGDTQVSCGSCQWPVAVPGVPLPRTSITVDHMSVQLGVTVPEEHLWWQLQLTSGPDHLRDGKRESSHGTSVHMWLEAWLLAGDLAKWQRTAGADPC